MATPVEFMKIVFIPAFISLSLFLSITYLVRPAVRRYQERYEQYLPLHAISGSLAQRTKSLKTRIGDRIMAFISPRFNIYDRGIDIDTGEELFDDDDGPPDMLNFDFRDIQRRREQLRREVGDMEGARTSGEEDYGEAA